MDGSTILSDSSALMTAAPDVLAAPSQNYSNLFVCLMGMGTVFFGLVCLIVLITLMGKICRKSVKAAPVVAAPAAPAAPVAVPAPAQRQELLAAVSAAIAEDMGTEPGAFRIVSIKKL